MPKGNTQSISSLIFQQTIEGVDLRTLEHGLDGCQVNALIAKLLDKLGAAQGGDGRSNDHLFDRELDHLPPEARWRE